MLISTCSSLRIVSFRWRQILAQIAGRQYRRYVTATGISLGPPDSSTRSCAGILPLNAVPSKVVKTTVMSCMVVRIGLASGMPDMAISTEDTRRLNRPDICLSLQCQPPFSSIIIDSSNPLFKNLTLRTRQTCLADTHRPSLIIIRRSTRVLARRI